jgi:NADH-quinone oxidoreductase subunit J
MMETALFYIFGGMALIAAISMVAQKKVIYSAISLIICLCAVAALYLLLEAPFIAAVQIIVYAGAIMVLFLFVIMLPDPFSASVLQDKKKFVAYAGGMLGALALGLFILLLRSYKPSWLRATDILRREPPGMWVNCFSMNICCRLR